MISGTAVRTLKEASISESGLNPECLIEIRWKVPSETTMPGAMSPLQFQKQLRLRAARQWMDWMHWFAVNERLSRQVVTVVPKDIKDVVERGCGRLLLEFLE